MWFAVGSAPKFRRIEVVKSKGLAALGAEFRRCQGGPRGIAEGRLATQTRVHFPARGPRLAEGCRQWRQGDGNQASARDDADGQGGARQPSDGQSRVPGRLSKLARSTSESVTRF